MGRQTIFCHLTADLDDLATHLKRLLAMFCQIQEASPRTLFILIASDEDGGGRLCCQSCGIPGARAASEHAGTADDTRRSAVQNPFAISLVAHKPRLFIAKGLIAFPNLTRELRRKRLWQQEIGRTDP